MASLFGSGYGAGKMFEGAASGMLKGRLYNDQMAQQATENKRADETLGMQKQRLDMAAQEEERQRQAIDQKITFESFGKAFDAGSKAPVGARSKTYEAVYKALNPQGSPPPVEFSQTGDEAKLTLSDGTVLAGGVEYIKQASQALATAPDQAKEIMQTALKTGVLRVEKQAQTDKPSKESLVSVQGYDEKGNKKTFFIEKQAGAARLPQGFSENDPRGGGMKPDQMVDNTKAHYAFLAKQYLDPMTGLVQKGYEQQYQGLVESYKRDVALAAQGQTPSWAQGQQQQQQPGQPGQQPATNTVTVKNPNTGETEVWDLDTEQRVQ